MAFQLVQILYWLALSTWFGGVLFVALSAPVILRTVRENNPILTNILSVNLEGQHGTLLAGTIVANLIRRLSVVELVCGSALLLTLILQPFVIDVSAGGGGFADNRAAAVLRTLLFLAAAAVAAYDRLVVWPKLSEQRQIYIDHADEPEIANPANEAFDREQRKSLSLLMALAALLLGMILFSASITPPVVTTAVAGR